jgi:hypothetical protein
VIHDHREESLHIHVLFAHHLNHADWHAGNHSHEHDDGDEGDGHDAMPQPVESDPDTVIRGTEVAVARKYEPATEVRWAYLMLVPPLIATAAPRVTSPPPRLSLDVVGGVRQTELACLRAVVLLI